MADLRLAARGSLDGLAEAGRHGREGETGVTLSVVPSGRQTAILARRGQGEALAEMSRLRGLALPPPGRVSLGDDLTVVAIGPGSWLAFGEEQGADRAGQFFGALSAACTLVRVDDARTRLGVGGPAARKTLAKLLTIDLHPRVFSPGMAAVTLAGGIAVTLWQLDETPRYALAVPRSFARSFWHWLLDSAAEFGSVVADGGGPDGLAPVAPHAMPRPD